MNARERAKYFGDLWPAACLANEWDVKDENRRRAVTGECMRLVRGPMTDSSSALGADEITALFCYLDHLANGASLEKSALWVTCQEDYQTFNRAKQADWHERALYGNKPSKLARDRFRGESSATVGPLESLDPDEVRKRHLTMASRHQKRQRRQKVENPIGLQSTPAAPIAPRPVPENPADVPF